MNKKWEYATLEWLWDSQSLSYHLPNGSEEKTTGSYAEVVQTLSKLGAQGWEVVTCASEANWLFWTLKREN
jgi:hypothetical protein